MSGLLSLLGQSTGDPNKDAALNQGLLQMGLTMLQGKGNFGQVLGQGGMAGISGYNQSMDQSWQQRQRSEQEKQWEEQKRRQERQKEMEALAQQFYRTPEQTSLMNGKGPTLENAARIGAPSFDFEGYANALAKYDPVGAMELRQRMRKQKPAPVVVAPGASLVNPENGQPVYQAPDRASSEDAFVRTLRAAGIDPASPEGQAFLRDRLRKESSHSPQVNVNYGQPVAGVDEKGNPVFFQPAKAGGTPAIVPGVRPAPQNRDTKLPAELQRMQIAGDTMVSLLNDYEAMLKKHNPRNPMTQMDPKVRAEIQSLKRNVELQFKELQALGALAGPDVEIMRQSLADPFSAAGAYYGKDGLLAQVGQARNLVKQRSDAVLKSQGRAPEPAAKQKQVKRTGTLNGRKVVEYDDGEVAYVD
jgi:hypothetical protein